MHEVIDGYGVKKQRFMQINLHKPAISVSAISAILLTLMKTWKYVVNLT